MIIDKNKYTHNNKYAHMAFQGDGIPVDKKEAAKYFKMAADKGYSGAMFFYAEMLERGDGIPSDMKESHKYYQMAADNGNEDAKRKLKNMRNF